MVEHVNRVLALYTWGGVGLLVMLVYRIAHFYQITAGERSYYRWFSVPAALFVLAAVRCAWLGDFVGDPLADVLLLLGGGSVVVLGANLLRLMTGGRG